MATQEAIRHILTAMLLVPMVFGAPLNVYHETEQVPSGDQLEVSVGGSSKISFRLWNMPGYKLYAGFKGHIFSTDEGHQSQHLSIVYNSCKDSDRPKSTCMEAQLTLRAARSFNGSYITFYLFSDDPVTNVPVLIKELSNVMVTVANETIEQTPSGDHLEIKSGSTNKTTLRLWTNEPGHKLFAAINGNTINHLEGHTSHFVTVVYNSCTDSDHPAVECLEAQVTLRGTKRMNGLPISFHLYDIDSNTGETALVKELSTVYVTVLDN